MIVSFHDRYMIDRLMMMMIAPNSLVCKKEVAQKEKKEVAQREKKEEEEAGGRKKEGPTGTPPGADACFETQ